METKRKKVMAAGHVCIDITPVIPGKKAARLEEILQPGKLIHTEGVDVHTGGAVANTGLAMKLLGADVVLAGKIGGDAFGKTVLDIMKRYDAQQGMLVSEKESTSYSVVIAVPGIDRVFLHDPGANDSFSSEDITDEMLEDIALFHFGYPPIMRRMFLNDGEELVKLFRRVKEMGIATSLDMAAVDPDSEAGGADWKRIIERVLPYVDFFVPSIEELAYMLDRELYEEWQRREAGRDLTELLSVEKDIAPLADRLIGMGARVVLLKCGVPGLYYRTASAEALQKIGSRLEQDFGSWADRSGFEESYRPDRVLSGTGAGDTSIAAFLTAVLDGEDLESCVRLAAAEGASNVEAYDALSGLKSLEELKKKIAAGWEKQRLLKA